MNTNSKAFRYLLTMGLVVFTVPQVGLAATATNENTGSHSINNIDFDFNLSNDTNIENDSETTNNVDLDFNTGDNLANHNTGNAYIATGGIETETKVTTVTGAAEVPLPVANPLPAIEATNSQTGANSEQSITISKEIANSVNISNRSSIENIVKGSANTGGNSATGNTGNARIVTGDIKAVVKIHNEANVRANLPAPTSSPKPGPGVSPAPIGGGQLPTPIPAPTVLAMVPAVAVSPTPGPSLAPSLTPKTEAAKIQTVTPREGPGGGFFAAGTSWLTTYLVLLFLAFAFSYADKLSVFLSRRFPWQESVGAV